MNPNALRGSGPLCSAHRWDFSLFLSFVRFLPSVIFCHFRIRVYIYGPHSTGAEWIVEPERGLHSNKGDDFLHAPEMPLIIHYYVGE